MSTLEHTRNSVSAAIRNLASEGPTFNLQRVTQIGDRFARVLGTVSAQATPDQIRNSLRKLNNKLTPIQGSFRALSSNGVTQSVEGIVGIISERIVLSDENKDHFKAVAGNMYMDDEERLWSMKKTEAGDILIKSHASDDMEVMTKLMSCVASTSVGMQEAEPVSRNLHAALAGIQGGDLVSFVNPDNAVVDMGFAIASVKNEDGSDTGKLAVVDRNDNVFQLDRNMVIAAVSGEEIEFDPTEEMEAVAAGNFSMEFIKDYYRRMFIRRPDYFEAFWKRFSSHAF